MSTPDKKHDDKTPKKTMSKDSKTTDKMKDSDKKKDADKKKDSDKKH